MLFSLPIGEPGFVLARDRFVKKAVQLFISLYKCPFDVSRSNCSHEIALSARSDKVPELAGGMLESHGKGNGQ
jgi:hypothetical protein